MQCSTRQFSTAESGTVQYRVAQYNAVQFIAVNPIDSQFGLDGGLRGVRGRSVLCALKCRVSAQSRKLLRGLVSLTVQYLGG